MMNKQIKIHKENKKEAWNVIGKLFWEIGHNAIRSNEKLRNLLLNNILSRDECCIIGSSAKPLIDELISRKVKTTVLDFSVEMNKALKNRQNTKLCDIFTHDIIRDHPDALPHSYSYIIADQVINCFSKQDLPIFFKNISKLLLPNGELRTTIKIGLYEIDKAIITEGKKLGTEKIFYDKSTQTINYTKAFDEIKRVISSINGISKNTFIEWYTKRGEELRFQKENIIEILSDALKIGGELLKIVEVIHLKKQTNMMFFRLKKL